MENRKLSLEELSDEFLKVYTFECEGDISFFNEDIDEKELKTLVRKWLKDESEECLFEFDDVLLKTDRKNLIKIIEKYYELAKDTYSYFEYEYGRFGNFDYLYELRLSILYLCGLYFDSIGDKPKADKSYYISLCKLNNYYVDEETISLLDCFENKFDRIKRFLHPDWLAINPSITHIIGKYYLSKNDYKKASEYFKIGASFDYEGRQSVEPFMKVGKNEYELGMLYLNGHGVRRNYAKALDLFERAASDAGQDYIPAMGDMYYLGLGVEKDLDMALDCYANVNIYNLDKDIYYRDLNDDQKKRLIQLIDIVLINNRLTYSFVRYIANVYKNRLNDMDKFNYYDSMKMELLKASSLEERSENEELAKEYVKYVLNELKDKLEVPKENTGFIPKDLKPKDIFTFGCFNGEPLEWKVLEKNEDGTFYVVTTKIVSKMTYEEVGEWLNKVFFEYSFTEEEKKHIDPHDYSDFYRDGDTYVYIPEADQFVEFEGTYEQGTIKQTKFAENLHRQKRVLCMNGETLLETGGKTRFIICSSIYGIRPAMDIKI